MANLTRFDPISDTINLRVAMDRLIEDSFLEPTELAPDPVAKRQPVRMSLSCRGAPSARIFAADSTATRSES